MGTKDPSLLREGVKGDLGSLLAESLPDNEGAYPGKNTEPCSLKAIRKILHLE
uniref:Uncharacterized protein n=1 Tax=Leptospirillum ferriphilum TaxID=178606 RepID=A0A2I2MDY2_9BACT